MATNSKILARKIPWTEEPGGLQSMGLQRVGHDRTTNSFTNDNDLSGEQSPGATQNLRFHRWGPFLVEGKWKRIRTLGSRAGDTFFDFISSNERVEEGTVEAQRKRRQGQRLLELLTPSFHRWCSPGSWPRPARELLCLLASLPTVGTPAFCSWTLLFFPV